jgi:WD40 repeat protein
LSGHQKPILSLDFNPNGTMLASGSGDNHVKLWAVKED